MQRLQWQKVGQSTVTMNLLTGGYQCVVHCLMLGTLRELLIVLHFKNILFQFTCRGYDVCSILSIDDDIAIPLIIMS